MVRRFRAVGQLLWRWFWSPTGRIAVRYSIASAISVGISLIVLFVTYGVLHLASAVVCNLIAAGVACFPSYYLNRNWAWRRSGRSHLWKEVVPFWVLAFVGLGLSLGAVDLAEAIGRSLGESHLVVSLMVEAASFLAYGIVWVGKFIIFNRLIFVDRSATDRARERPGRSFLPTRQEAMAGAGVPPERRSA
jgi:putative flippase GtrA